MADCTLSNSKILFPNGDPKSSELDSKCHISNPENSFDEVFSLLESTLIDLKDNDRPTSVDVDHTDVTLEINSNNPVGTSKLGKTNEILNIDYPSRAESLGLDCKSSRIYNCSSINSLRLDDLGNDNSMICQCNHKQNTNLDDFKCSCKVFSGMSSEMKHIQMSTEIDLKSKVSNSCNCSYVGLCSCLSSVVPTEEYSDSNSEIKQGLKLNDTRSTCIEDFSAMNKESAADISDINLKINNCVSDKTNFVPLEMKTVLEEQNIESVFQLTEAITDIVNEDELLANEDGDLNLKDMVGMNCIVLENNAALEEELLSDENDRETSLSNKNNLVEHFKSANTSKEDIDLKISRPTSVKPVEILLDEKEESKLASTDREPQNMSTVSMPLCTDKEFKSDCVQDISTASEGIETNRSLNKNNFQPNLQHGDHTKLYCSTPVGNDKINNKTFSEKLKNKDFGSMSPLGIISVSRNDEDQYLKRKASDLLTIREEEEMDSFSIKRMKSQESNLEDSRRNSSRKTLEAPAVSLLKKWRPSCLNRNSYYVIDEIKDEAENVDDYEDAIRSLSETLMKESEIKGSTPQEAYKDHVLAENNHDNLKFTEAMLELTQELQDQFDEEDRFLEDINEVTVTENTVLENIDRTLLPEVSKEKSTLRLPPKEILNQSLACQILVEKQDSDSNGNELSSADNDLSIIYSNVEDKNKDEEEDILLKEGEFDDKLKKKPRDLEFFVSNDPLENEDNGSKEWDLLRKLSTDEERYKAVRERWRSLTIPDPKRDLTYRQWRVRNNLPPPTQIKTKTENRQNVNEPATRLCTVLFDQNIAQILRHLEFKRREVRLNLARELQRLGFQQENEQKQLFMIGASERQIYSLHCHHIQEVRSVKERYESEERYEERKSRERMDALKVASEEVLAFEKYYQGLDGNKLEGNKSKILLTNTEIEELAETECMLEQYDRYYNGP